MLGLARKIFGSKNDRDLKRIQPLVERINSYEPTLASLSDEQLRSKTTEFREQMTKGRLLDELLPETFAVVREASKRALGMRHFDVQMIGGVVLHQGKISEMKTGEGKTLVATLPVYLNALEGKGVHVVTVNDYLAKRDSEWMGRIYRFLGLSVGVIIHGLNDTERRQAYASDITYGTNNEFGFDFLRDNMKFEIESMVQRELNYAIVDEVDSILIDEARTPLIISGQAEESTDKYVRINAVVPGIEKDRHYQLDEKSRTVVLSEEGVSFFEKRLSIDNLYDPNNIEILHHVNQALRAHTLFKRDVDYVVKDNKVMIVDEFTGRLMPGRRWSDGLHQAIEAKEGARIENENQTLASITFQNYFRIYKKLAGMTGTADTEAAEFAKIYNLDVMLIPTNQPMIRADNNDVIYKSHNAKFNAVVEEIKELNDEGRPVLVGTIAIEKSELLSGMLKRRGVPHHVLNAKQHEREAEIIAQAGRVKGVTVSTNMAGRGTDIMLGGNPEFMARASAGKEATEEAFAKALQEAKGVCQKEKDEVIRLGGLLILGTERHESRRIDNQLRGRAGRQGDPGASRFFVSLEDDLMRIFGSDRIAKIMGKLGMKEDETIEHPWISRAIENAQKKVEAHNFDIRKTVLEYDDVMNQQRMTVYAKRKRIMKGEDLKEQVTDALDAIAESISEEFDPKKNGGELNREGLEERLYKQFGLKIPFDETTRWDADSIGLKIYDDATAAYQKKEEEYRPEMMRRLERFILLSTLDGLWKDHLLAMDHLREGIGLRGYGQKDPRMEYKREGFAMFEAMIGLFYEDSLEKLFKVQVTGREEIPVRRARVAPVQMGRGEVPAIQAGQPASPGAVLQAQPVRKGQPQKPQTIHREGPKVGRNDPCPCGSGKKYKKCHGV